MEGRDIAAVAAKMNNEIKEIVLKVTEKVFPEQKDTLDSKSNALLEKVAEAAEDLSHQFWRV